MWLLDWLRGRRKRRDPEAEWVEQSDKLRAYFRDRGVPDELGRDESAFAVLWPMTDDPTPIRQLGERLRAWAGGQPGVTRILGLERLLEGQRPEVAVTLLMIPFCPAAPEKCVERVARVAVRGGASTEALGISVCELGERDEVARG